MTGAIRPRTACTMPCVERFSIEPRGPFSLAVANGFGFGPRDASADETMRLALAADGDYEPAAVALTEDADGVVYGSVQGEAPVDVVRAQVARILSLDHDGAAWEAIGAEDPALGRVQAMHPGLRPVLFHSPYEAAAWAILSARQPRAHALALRQSIAERWGTAFEVEGTPMAAFPPPDRLIEAVEAVHGYPEERLRRMRGVAEAATEGTLDADRLRALGPEAATEEMLKLRGIGPFYASLIVVRAAGFSDAFVDDPGARKSAEHFGVLAAGESLAEHAERWRPFRTWATVLLRVAGGRAGVIRNP